MTFCLTLSCLQGEVELSALMEALMQHQAERFSKNVSRLAASPRRLSINHMYDELWLHDHIASGTTKQGIDSLAPSDAQVAAQ